jgi:pimeloyl-ACP methyl ester carboxylesterase
LIFYDGFQFQNSKKLVKKWLKDDSYTVGGFSYGATLALRKTLETTQRIDTLQLFSPAFFNGSSEAFKKSQLLGFRRNRENYRKLFFENSFYPDEVDSSYISDSGSISELKDLLYWNWVRKDLQKLEDRGVEIEVYIGERDRIIDSQKAVEFFRGIGQLCYIKGVGHTLS